MIYYHIAAGAIVGAAIQRGLAKKSNHQEGVDITAQNLENSLWVLLHTNIRLVCVDFFTQIGWLLTCNNSIILHRIWVNLWYSWKSTGKLFVLIWLTYFWNPSCLLKMSVADLCFAANAKRITNKERNLFGDSNLLFYHELINDVSQHWQCQCQSHSCISTNEFIVDHIFDIVVSLKRWLMASSSFVGTRTGSIPVICWYE